MTIDLPLRGQIPRPADRPVGRHRAADEGRSPLRWLAAVLPRLRRDDTREENRPPGVDDFRATE